MSAEDGPVSSARLQRAWLEAIDTKVEAEKRVQRSQEALDEARCAESQAQRALFESQDSSPESE